MRSERLIREGGEDSGSCPMNSLHVSFCGGVRNLVLRIFLRATASGLAFHASWPPREHLVENIGAGTNIHRRGEPAHVFFQSRHLVGMQQASGPRRVLHSALFASLFADPLVIGNAMPSFQGRVRYHRAIMEGLFPIR